MIAVLVLIALASVLLFNIVGKSLPPLQLQPFTVLLAVEFFALFFMAVVFVSQPAIGMLFRANAFLSAPIEHTKLD